MRSAQTAVQVCLATTRHTRALSAKQATAVAARATAPAFSAAAPTCTPTLQQQSRYAIAHCLPLSFVVPLKLTRHYDFMSFAARGSLACDCDGDRERSLLRLWRCARPRMWLVYLPRLLQRKDERYESRVLHLRVLRFVFMRRMRRRRRDFVRRQRRRAMRRARVH